jgi:hypothetical protein
LIIPYVKPNSCQGWAENRDKEQSGFAHFSKDGKECLSVVTVKGGWISIRLIWVVMYLGSGLTQQVLNLGCKLKIGKVKN